jgi:hypothetical protein
MRRALLLAVLVTACTETREFFPGGSDAGARVSCTDRYGATRGFRLCFDFGAECGFEAFKASVTSCDQVCAAGGGRCVRAYGNDSTGDTCVPNSTPPDGCTRTNRDDDICVCSSP